MDNTSRELEKQAEALLKAEAERKGISLRDMGVLSRHRLSRCTCSPSNKKACGRIDHFERYSLETIQSVLLNRQDEEEEGR